MYALLAIKFRDARLRKWLLDTHQSPLKECVRSKEGFLEYAHLYWRVRTKYAWSNTHGTTSVQSKPPEPTKRGTSATSYLNYRVQSDIPCATTVVAVEIMKCAPSAPATPL